MILMEINNTINELFRNRKGVATHPFLEQANLLHFCPEPKKFGFLRINYFALSDNVRSKYKLVSLPVFKLNFRHFT
jgi:hypothetical protein